MNDETPDRARSRASEIPGGNCRNPTQTTDSWQLAWLPGPILRRHWFRSDELQKAPASMWGDAGACRIFRGEYRLAGDTADLAAAQ